MIRVMEATENIDRTCVEKGEEMPVTSDDAPPSPKESVACEDENKPAAKESCVTEDSVSCSVSQLIDEIGTTVALIAEDDKLAKASPTKSSCNTLEEDKQNSVYHIKWISLNNCKTPVITQNENGPCPLLAIINVLILRGRIKLPPLVDIVTSEKLMQQLADCILDSIPQNIPEGRQLDYEQNINDAMAVLPKLQTGLDVNVKFTGVGDFEYTPECIIFDLLRIPLYHGWLIDPQMNDVVQSIGTFSYNQIVEKIINFKSSTDTDKVTEALIAESFLEKTASQLTYHGLWKLSASLREDELCVLFRNNHFISLVKQNGVLYQLVTDQGFLNENVVWETLDNIEGDGQFVDSNFVPVPPKAPTTVALPPDVPVDQQVDQDFLVALSLQEEQNKQQKSELEWEEFKKKNLGAATNLPDEELARRLQEAENRRNEQRVNKPPEQPDPNAADNRSRRNDDIIPAQRARLSHRHPLDPAMSRSLFHSFKKKS